jgi:hypothetical protein
VSGASAGKAHHRWMGDALGMLLVAAGVVLTLLTRDRLWLVIAFAGVTVLDYGVLRPHLPGSTDGKEPPIF